MIATAATGPQMCEPECDHMIAATKRAVTASCLIIELLIDV